MSATDTRLTDVERAEASRPLIPSERELALGGAQPVEFVDEIVGTVEEHAPLRQQLRAQLTGMNPFAVVSARSLPFIGLLFGLNLATAPPSDSSPPS
jgi:hypothetical protein